MKEGEEVVELDMTPILLEDLGMKYPTKDSKQKKRYGIFKCQYCEKEFETQVCKVLSKNTNSCGCYGRRRAKECNTKHGLSSHSLYPVWKNMKDRCINERATHYADYGGRGINISKSWADNFEIFYNWAIQNGYQEGLTLDRIDVNGNYEPDNCRWTTKEVQARNTRDLQINNTSRYRGVYWHSQSKAWRSVICVNYIKIYLGVYRTALEAAKAYERYVRLNNLEHTFTPALSAEELKEFNYIKDYDAKLS